MQSFTRFQPVPCKISMKSALTSLSHKSAILYSDDGLFNFYNTVFSIDISGILVMNKEGEEFTHKFNLKSNQLHIPLHLRYDSGLTQFKFISRNETLIEGSVHISAMTKCQRLRCLFCPGAFCQLNCLPTTIQHPLYTAVALISTLILFYLRFLCSNIVSMTHECIRLTNIFINVTKFVGFMLSTKCLQTSDTPTVIEFKTDSACHGETICLIFRERRSYESI